MKARRRPLLNQRSPLLPLVLIIVPTFACTATPSDSVGASGSALFTNGDFESGAAGSAPPSWTVSTFLNPGVSYPPAQRTDLNLSAGGDARTILLSTNAGAESQVDPTLGPTASIRWPRFGNQVALVNNQRNNRNANSLKQTMSLSAADVDSTDGKVHIRFVVAPVLQNPNHALQEQPYYWVELTNLTTGTTVYRDYSPSAQPGVPWKTNADGSVYYLDWQLVDITSRAGATIAAGDQVQLEVIASGCSLGGHWGQVYVDGVGPTVPGLFVSGSAPTATLAGGNLTYALTYTNGGSGAAGGVQVSFTMPPATTFSSISAPGLTCTTPAVGSPGKVSCAVTGTLAPGASGSFTVQVKVDAATAYDSTIVAGNYDIVGFGTSPLLGNKLLTKVGCGNDSQCGSGSWCKVSTAACMPTVANGLPLPIDPPHVAPALNGMCTAAVGSLVCTSAVCDTTDNLCGYAVGGPCTAGNAATVCRSTTCSAGGTCMTVGGCNVDEDCSNGTWCTVATHSCTARLPNGAAIPMDPPHRGPVLDGSCSPQVGLLVCASGVCDPTDDKCGYANGAGPCTAATAAATCRSGLCSLAGRCIPLGGCGADGDCAGASEWCNISAAACTTKLGNGAPMPTDVGHGTAPKLDGTCIPAAAALVCLAATCEPGDGRCGLANGTSCRAAGECRSDTCFAGDGKCGKPVSQPCSASSECRSNDCTADAVCDGDTDGDGVSDRTEVRLGTDPTRKDSDDDGVADNVELSAGGSGVGPFTNVDTDADGLIDALDSDDDGDTVPTKDELGTGGGTNPMDTDLDGKRDYLDDDDDGDTLPTRDELGGAADRARDSDGDGKKDYLDDDDDDDAVPTKGELGAAPGPRHQDTDNDGTEDYLDTDDDGDSLLTRDELGARGPAAPADSDHDGKVDYLDPDDDNDGILTRKEIADTRAAGRTDDVDGDKSANWLDTDSDGDNVPDRDETSDVGNNGIPDYLEVSSTLPPPAPGAPPCPVAPPTASSDADAEGSIEGGACSATSGSGSGSATEGGAGAALTLFGLLAATLVRRRRQGLA